MSRQNYKPWYQNSFILLAGAVIVIALTVLVLELTNTTHWFHHSKITYPNPVDPHNKSLNQGPASPNKQGSTNSETPSPQPTQAENGATLQAPSGSFVSNHKPTLTGQPGPTEQSICVTTPGASCVITFTGNGVTKSLTPQIVNTTGSTSWTWSLQDIGIANGTWTITAKSILGNQTKSTVDPLQLEVQP